MSLTPCCTRSNRPRTASAYRFHLRTAAAQKTPRRARVMTHRRLFVPSLSWQISSGFQTEIVTTFKTACLSLAFAPLRNRTLRIQLYSAQMNKCIASFLF